MTTSSAVPAAKPFAMRWRDAVLSAAGPPNPTTRLLLVALTKYMDSDGGQCYPATATLARDTGLSERSVCTHIQIASEQGFVLVAERKRQGYGWRRHVYSPTLPERKRTEPASVPTGQRAEAGSARPAKGTEPRDTKVLNLVPKRTEGGSVDHTIDHSIDHGAPQGGRPARSRAVQLPKSFTPDATGIAKAEQLGVDLESELEKFSNHAQANGRTAKDWQAALRNWLIKAHEFGRGQPVGGGRPSQRRVSPSDYEITSYD